jgi:hypothetical protein
MRSLAIGDGLKRCSIKSIYQVVFHSFFTALLRYVLRALGVEEDLAHTSIRFGLGRFTTEAEVQRAIDHTVEQVTRLREMSPLWEMVQEGVDISKIQWSQH